MALPASDTFTGADGTALTTYSANWTINTGSFLLISNALRANVSGGFSLARWSADVFPNDQKAQVDYVPAAGSNGAIGPAVRISTAGATSCYGLYTDTSNLRFFRLDAGSYSEFATTTPLVFGDVMRIEAEGSTIRVYVNGVLWTSTTDSTYSAGSGGIAAFADFSYRRVDNFSAGALTVATYAPPPSRGPRLPFAILAQ